MLGEAHQSKSIGLRVHSCVIDNVAVLHPWRHHTELVPVHRSPIEWENVGVVQAFPQQHFFTKPLWAIVSSPQDPQRSADQENRYPCCFVSIIIGSEPQRLDCDLSSIIFPFPQVGISTCCEGYFFLGLQIFIDQARSRQPPECPTQSPKHGKRSAFEIARDALMLKDL
jgi:hypothetical protein